jgi:hypothetical protein
MTEENNFLVVSELPQTQVRVVKAEDGKTYDLITTEEAVKEILETIRLISKSVVGK